MKKLLCVLAFLGYLSLQATMSQQETVEASGQSANPERRNKHRDANDNRLEGTHRSHEGHMHPDSNKF